MSTKRGSGQTRIRPQKYKNSFSFKNDLHDKTPQMKRINQINVCEVCERCKAQIEWKIKYKKYKPLSQAKTCIKCNQRTIKKAYHVICRECSKKERVCAKCLKSADETSIDPPEPSMSEQQKLKSEMDRLIKGLPERKRRTFLRYMAKGKEAEQEGKEKTEDENEPTNDEEKLAKKRIPHSREELLQKIEMLKINDEDNDSDIDDDLVDSEYENALYSDDLDSDDYSD